MVQFVKMKEILRAFIELEKLDVYDYKVVYNIQYQLTIDFKFVHL